MAIAFVQVKDSGNNGSGSGSTSNVSITPTQGSTLVIAFHQHSSNALVSVTDTNGTPVAVVAGTVNAGLSYGLYVVKNAAAGAHSITVTFASTGWTDLVVAEYSGADPNNPVDASNSASGNVFGTAPSVNVTTTGSNELVFGYVHMENVAVTVGSGFTSRDTFDSNQVQDKAAASAGTYAVGTAATSTSSWVVVALALQGTSVALSVKDCRTAKPNSATTHAVNGTNLCDQQTSSNPAIPPTDSRVSAPVASGTYPQNSRTWPLQ